MTPLVREQVQEVEELLLALGPLSEPEVRALVGAVARVAARSPFEVAVLTVHVGDGEPEVRVSVGGDASDGAEADVPVVLTK